MVPSGIPLGMSANFLKNEWISRNIFGEQGITIGAISKVVEQTYIWTIHWKTIVLKNKLMAI